MVRSGGEAVRVETGSVPAVATPYFHAVFHPAHRDMGIRNSREARTLCRALDHLARKEYGEAADLLGQRLKAVEKATKDGNNWSRAQWLELLPPEGLTLIGRDEEAMTAYEEQLQTRLNPLNTKGKGKDGKGKDGKDGKGKGRNK